MKRGPLTAIGVVLLLLIAGMLALHSLLGLRPLPLESGSALRYIVSGSVNNTTMDAPLEGAIEVSISEYTEEGHSYTSFATGYYRGVQIVDARPFYQDGPGGMMVGHRRTETPLGPKTVESWLMPFDDHLVITEIGLESSVLYRMTVASPEYHYTISLAQAERTNLQGYDNQFDLPEVDSLTRPSEPPSIWVCGQDGTGEYQGYGYCYGSLEIGEGENISYSVTGNRTTALFFSDEDLALIEETGLYGYNRTLSRLAGDPGSLDSRVRPGTYWYLFAMRSSGRAVFHWQA